MPNVFAVNKTTNKQWWYRLRLVHELANWVFQHLDSRHATWGKSLDKKATPEGRRTKAMQYVIEHMALGVMLFPLERADPLFTEKEYEDESLQLQLEPGTYPAFRAQVEKKIERLRAFDPASRETISWDEATNGINEAAIARLEQLWTRLERKRKLSESQIEQEMIGLVLRYKCMGGFENTFHGSVPAEWGQRLADYHECFASPLNHKFKTYYSMFEQDKVFGSNGNFFAAVQENRGILPSGYYEINPPWMNASFEMVARILKRSINKGSRITTIMVGPCWKDTRWIPALKSLVEELPHSHSGIANLLYSQDMNGETFKLKTIYWVISTDEMPEGQMRFLRHTLARDRS